MTSTINASTTAGIVTTADTSGVLQLQTAGTTAVSISSGQVATFAQAPVLPAASIPQAALAAGVAGNGPAFSVYASTAQSFTANTYTKVTFDTEVFDTNSNFASSRFTPTVAGYYQINAGFQIAGTANLSPVLRKNNTDYAYGTQAPTLSYVTTQMSALMYMNGSTDYAEFFISSSVSLSSSAGSATVYMSGSMVRSA